MINVKSLLSIWCINCFASHLSSRMFCVSDRTAETHLAVVSVSKVGRLKPKASKSIKQEADLWCSPFNITDTQSDNR